MAFLFRKKNETEAVEPDKNHDRVLRQMVNSCLRLQTSWAQWMGERTEHLSNKTLHCLLLVFIVLAGGYSIHLIGQSFSGHQTNAFSVTPIKKPKHVLQSRDDVSLPYMIVRETNYQRIIQFRRYMDSLARSPTGKAMHDNILLSRPGLQDSIRLIEKIYHSQTKK